jgi:hypothetical protein
MGPLTLGLFRPIQDCSARWVWLKVVSIDRPLNIQLILPIFSHVRDPLSAGAALYKVSDMINRFSITVLWFSSEMALQRRLFL